MDIVLGVSMTPTTVRMALVEGDKADGEIVDHDIFETDMTDGAATPVEQVVSAILGTRESAEEGGHHLKSVGVAWSDHDAAARLRDALDAAGVNDVMMVSELHAAGSLAQAAGEAVGYSSTGLLFVDRDTATMSVVQPDGSISKVLSRSLHSTDAMAVLSEMAAAVTGAETSPQGMFVVGSGVDVTAVQAHLAELMDIPVSAPGDSDLALARGAALASASAPMFDASTAGLAYSAAGGAVAAPLAATPLLTADEFGFDELGDAPVAAGGSKPFLLVGSALTSIFVVGVVALAISLAVSIRPTVDQRPAPAQAAIVPSAPVAVPAPPPSAVPPPAPVAAVPEPAPVQAPSHVDAPQVVKESAPQVHVPAAAPVPEAPAPVPVSMPDVPAAPVVPPPAAVPDPPAVIPQPVIAIPGPPPPVWNPWVPRPQQPQWGNDYPNYPSYPSRHGRGDDGDGYPGGYPGNGYPGNQYPGGSNGYPGDYPGNNGHGNGNGNGKKQKQPNCFLIFCAPN
ncbi:hypothetical protein FZI85_11690 [Mycobacterium sp. CBMA293]|nr:hypothetical protein [Mycolicibacterium sp. CBMA 360]MUL59198.1 hypothetical protein [Mycolicibacterium sp. CBMA 335]MUL70923.1 hypothetical protein [Mycolicibacterium sp. CBMA 311]MUL94566.1 hypothetical protein [Mycolicibacterium sp. CBMA 230]MUM09257.1 hypothetical protein [Mycolicibacterium sp. CBMA 213]MUM11685.1 hypothetical protein [Mycolicibacterium sp. CBMA 293]MUM30590.1 hypothetical protein [Mycolicibacterium sp. CBMA 361]